MPASMPTDLPRRTLSALHAHGTNSNLLLRQAQLNQEMLGDRILLWLQLWRDLRCGDALWGALLRPALP